MMTAANPADFHKRKKPYWIIPVFAVLLIVIGAAAPANQIIFGLMWGLVFSFFALFMVVLSQEEPAR